MRRSDADAILFVTVVGVLVVALAVLFGMMAHTCSEISPEKYQEVARMVEEVPEMAKIYGRMRPSSAISNWQYELFVAEYVKHVSTQRQDPQLLAEWLRKKGQQR